MPYPEWLHRLAWIYLWICFGCAGIVLIDFLRGHQQRMWIMRFVWPVSALYWGPVAVWLYFRTRPYLLKQPPRPEIVPKPDDTQGVRPEQVWVADFHCGAGCTLGDIVGEWAVFLLAWTWVAGSSFATELMVDFILAFSLGIFFQYFTIAPMKKLGPVQGLLAALRADTASILAFEIGLFGWMALAYYVLFPNPHLHPNEAVHWFMMQVGMIIGFFTAYPANLWLIRRGWKEKMPQYPRSQPKERQAA